MRTALSSLLTEWGPFLLAGVWDVVTAGGFVPANLVAGVRFILLYGLFRQGTLAFLVTALLPRVVPITLVFILMRQWRAFRVRQRRPTDVHLVLRFGSFLIRSRNGSQEGSRPLSLEHISYREGH